MSTTAIVVIVYGALILLVLDARSHAKARQRVQDAEMLRDLAISDRDAMASEIYKLTAQIAQLRAAANKRPLLSIVEYSAPLAQVTFPVAEGTSDLTLRH